MAADERWYFTREQLANTPSRRHGIDADKELSYRQQAANFIQDMGQRLVVSQLCINTAIVYMHRFYVFHSLTQFHRNSMAVAALFLAAKVEEQPRKLEHVIKIAYTCLHREASQPDPRSEQFLEQAQDLVFNENVLLQTLGFDVAIDHPHTHVVRCCQLVKASKDLAQTSYFMASNSLHLTTMCLQYKPTVVACFCIHLACKWSNWEIPQSTEGRQWFWYVDKTVTGDLLQELTDEFLHIFDKCPSRLKRKIMSISANQSPTVHHPSLPNSPFDAEPRRTIQSPADNPGAATVAHLMRFHSMEGVPGPSGMAHSSRSHHTTTDSVASSSTATSSRSHHVSSEGAVAHSSRSHHVSSDGAVAHSSRSHHQEKQDEKKAVPGPSTSRTAMDYREYREKKERERLEREKAAAAAAAAAAIGCHIPDPGKPPHHSHHHKPMPSVSSKHQMPVQKGTGGLHHNHHHRSDLKVGQPVPQRHSTSGSHPRDPNRQRLSREHNIAHSSSHAHVNLDGSAESHRSDTAQDSLGYGGLPEKLSNNNHSGHRLNAMDGKHQAHDKRLYRGEDPRLKSAKYADMSRMENQRRKTEEQRCEEVRKLIEKPLPPPKQADMPYLINAQKQQQQQAHHSKGYNQQQDKSGSSFDAKHLAAISQDASPSAVSQQKSAASAKTQLYNQHTVQGVSQILKDTIKNGSSQSCLNLNNVDDQKPEKRPPRTAAPGHEENLVEKNSVDVHTPPPPPGKHRSLFSPETPTSREPQPGARPTKSKQKTLLSASAAKLKERASPFANSPGAQDASAMKRSASSDGMSTFASHNKRARTSSSGETAVELKIKTEIKQEESLEAMKMLGRVPDLIQPIRDGNNPSSNRNGAGAAPSSSVVNDLKPPPELIKPFDSDQPRFNAIPSQTHKVTAVTLNGIDLNSIKQEFPEYRVKREPLEQHYIKKEPGSVQRPSELSLNSQLQPKFEFSSPIKSAQSISALLQQPLPQMPSLLQGLPQLDSQIPSQVHQEQQQQLQSIHHQLPATTPCLVMPTVSDSFTSIASTVDISILSDGVSMILPNSSSIPEVATSVVASSSVHAPMTVAAVEEKRSEHHKSEKKKKKEKHKHKDKEKSKEKHKHKHKDKDKERHREKKERSEEVAATAAAPIKITIPKDKLNLSTDTSPSVLGGASSSSEQNKNISPQGTGLKIKIPKERLKGTDSVSSSPAQQVQGSLKIKIRTDGISRSSVPPPASSSTNGSGQFSSETTSVNEMTTRKRGLEVHLSGDGLIPGSGDSSLLKKLTVPGTSYGQSHRPPGERQNGRHYNSGSNNKERHTSSHHKNASKQLSQQFHAT
ncbi:cyclin-T isoform X2 [Nylanderia fulva]|uniref:cyclin-T isoform X2 n=1 Tax=Nylanderia fulva TaxID=613905 RepID=UPI0010FB0047|nr:cyclin-T isoform X2 [Nylanderia fulva]